MKTLTSFIVNPALYREIGIEAQPGDQVELYLNQDAVPGFPEFIVGTIQNPVTTVCGGTSYDIEYDETDFAAVEDVEELVPDLVSSVVVVSEARVLFAAEEANRIAGDLSLRLPVGRTLVATDVVISIADIGTTVVASEPMALGFLNSVGSDGDYIRVINNSSGIVNVLQGGVLTLIILKISQCATLQRISGVWQMVAFSIDPTQAMQVPEFTYIDLYNTTQNKYQRVTISGTAGNEVIDISDIP